MKKILLLLVVSLITLNIQAQENDTTTYYLIRHAEKDRRDNTNKNPDLTEEGLQRAENWSTVFENIKFDLIYSTKYNRTIQTAEPTALKQGLEIQFYSPSHLNDENFQKNTKGKTVLVVGHSNTTPQFVNDLLGAYKYEDIDDKNNSNLYIVISSNIKKTDILLKI